MPVLQLLQGILPSFSIRWSLYPGHHRKMFGPILVQNIKKGFAGA